MRLAGLTLLLCGCFASSAAAATQGLFDDPSFFDYRTKKRGLALDRAKAAGARFVRLTADWSLIAPVGSAKPEGFRAVDPSDPGYTWGYLDATMRDVRRR